MALFCNAGISVQASDEKRETTAPTGAVELASLAICAGAVGTAIGAAGEAVTFFPKELANIVPPAAYDLLLQAKPYAWVALPSLVLVTIADLYLRKSAQTKRAKRWAGLGSCAIFFGTIAVVAGWAGAAYALKLRDTLQTVAEVNNVNDKSLWDISLDTWKLMAKRTVSLTNNVDAELKWYDGANKLDSMLQHCYTGFAASSFAAVLGASLAFLGYEMQP